MAKSGQSLDKVLEEMKEIIENEDLAKIDYINAVDLATMKDARDLDGDRLIAIAVYIGKTRLIDNFIYRV